MESLNQLIEVIRRGLRHPNYARSLELADLAAQIFAEKSEGQRKSIEGIRHNETPEQLAARLRVSSPVTGPALAGPISYQSRIARAPDRTAMFKYEDEAVQARISENFERFYQGDDLYSYIFARVCDAANHDPNAWLIFETMPAERNGGQRIYPVEVSSEEAIWHEADKTGILEHFCFRRRESVADDAGGNINYWHYWMYSRGQAAEAIELEKGVIAPEGFNIIPIKEGTSPNNYAVRQYEMPFDFVPAEPLGCYKDPLAQGMGYGLFYQAALPILRDMMIKASSLHVQEAGTAFPKRFEFVKSCRDVNEQGEQCIGGYYSGITEKANMCRNCHGTGKVKQTNEMESVELEWADGMTVENFIDLSRLIYDHRPPVESLAYLDGKLQAFYRLIGSLIFNQDLTQGVSMRTATEVNAAEDTITNHLRNMAECIERAWEFAHMCALGYYSANLEKFDASLTHPADFQIARLEDVINEMKLASEAGAGAEAVLALKRRILHRLHRNDTNMVESAMAFERHRPYADKPDDVAMAIIQGLAPDDPTRVLWENFFEVKEEVFARMRELGIAFHELKWARQKSYIAKAVEAKTAAMKLATVPELPEPMGFNFNEPEDE